MLIKRLQQSWQLPESQVTPESVYLNRRQFMGNTAKMLAGSALFFNLNPTLHAAKSGLPAPTNPKYNVQEREVTEKKLATTYNNFYEFSSEKDDVHELVKDWNTENWKLDVSGLVNKPKTYDLEQFVKRMPLEERVYRFRCVETWAMVVPWTGFPFSQLLKEVEPKPEAKYIQLTTFENRRVAKGQLKIWLPWPYVEGLRMDEAQNELTMLVTGMYGKPLPKQNGAPIRLIVPWKYGFKSIKSIVKIEFVKQQPATFWNTLLPKEYGFYANVNPNVDHPRWSQKSERLLGTMFRREPTLLFNGYQEQVSHLYREMDLTKFF